MFAAGFVRDRIDHLAFCKAAVSVIKPNVQTSMGDRLFNHDIGVRVVVNIQGRYAMQTFGRFEGDLDVRASRVMEFDPKGRATTTIGLQKNRAVRPVVVVEIGNSEGSSKRGDKICPRQGTFKPVLRTEA